MKDNELRVFHKRIKNNLSKLKSFGEYLSTYISSDRPFLQVQWRLSIFDELTESKSLINTYNSLSLEKLPEVKSIEIADYKKMELWKIDAILMNLQSILREVEEVNDYLNIYLSPNISQDEQSKIKWAREELEKLKEKELDLDILQNLEEAISEGESGHYLACGIISGRIIDYIIQFIKTKENLPKENTIDNLITQLRNIGVLEKEEIAGQDKKEFLDAAKSARDAVSHNPKFMPNGPKAFSLLSYSFIISDLFVKYREIRKNENC